MKCLPSFIPAATSRWMVFYVTLLVLFACSCRKDKPVAYEAGTDEYVNDWVLDSMRTYYYWSNTLPAQPPLDQYPLDFFSAIKNQDDRFSRLVHPALRESYYPSLARTFGIELVLNQSVAGEVKAVLTLVVPGSTAQLSGLQRGDIVKQIQGEVPTSANIQRLVLNAIKGGLLQLDLGNRSVSIGAGFVTENPVYAAQVMEAGATTCGYLFYNSFEGRSKYSLIDAFDYFKSRGITDLIIDLRYNSGGDIGMCAALCAMIANVHPSDVFAIYRGNKYAGSRTEHFDKAISKISGGYSFSFSEIETARLSLRKIFIITGPHTASAAEFFINALKPLIGVVQVGEATLGKDMASFPIQDNAHPDKNQWIIEPLVFKLYNSRGEGDYEQGLAPDIAASEFSAPLVPFGDRRDALLAICLKEISGPARKNLNTVRSAPATILYDSRDAADNSLPSVMLPR